MPALLHVHSWYSLLEGTASLPALIQAARDGGHDALALTDTNNLYGAVPFAARAARAGLRPLLGACLEHGGQRAIALAADAAGYRNLCRLISRIRIADCRLPIANWHKVPGGESLFGDGLCNLQSAILNLQSTEGLHLLVADPALLEPLVGVFRGRLWVEVVRPGDPRRERDLLACAERLRLPLIASTAAYLAHADEHPTHRLVTAVRGLTLLDRVPARLPVTPEHRLVSAGELRQRFRDLPQAVRNADALASLLRSDVLPRELVLPSPVLTRPLDLVEYLKSLCERGLRERDLGADLKARDRLRRELAIIIDNGLPGYFLTVRDIARAARKRGHTMALRGSAGNSLVCYLLGITDVDPLRFRLEMERFLHPGRADLPDIDLDFDWKVRDEIIDYVIERYGPAHVARISAHQFYQPRSAFREAGKVHGLSTEQVSELLTTLDERVDAMLLPDGRTLTTPPCPRSFPLEPGRWPRLIDDARRLLGRPMHLALHCGGVVITPRPIDGYVPVQWAAKGVLMTQYEKDAVEAIGLVKIDLLGNRALSTVDEARGHARAAVPTPVASADDPATVALLQRGDTVGITQLESPAMRHLLMQMRPRGLDDVVQALALLRPGAASIGMKERFIRRRHGLEVPPPAHPLLDVVLGETHGLMLYEDDALRVIQALTGLPPADADRFRKRVSKHRTDEEAEALYREFVGLCERNGVVATGGPPVGASSSRAAAGPGGPPGPTMALAELWAQLAKFNRYSFCKSHSVSYGLIAWQAAYLKAHHPLAFWAAALNNNMGAYPPRVYIEAIKRAGIEVRPPCANQSRLTVTVEGDTLRVGLEAVAGVPEAVRAALLKDRDANGPFRDLADLRRRVSVGPEALAALLRAGALDFTGRGRPALYLEAELKDKESGKSGELFDYDPTEGWSPPDDPPERRWRDQWRSLGFVLGPPLFSLFRKASAKGPPLVASHEVPRHAGRLVRVQGLVATARQTHTEEGRPLQFVTLEDEHGLTEVTIFDGTCRPVPYLTIGPYVATGVVEDRFGACAVTARRFEAM